MVDDSDNRTRLEVRTQDLGDLSADQQRAIRNIAVSPYLIQPLQAPAGAGKTHSLKALRAAAHRARKQVLAHAPIGKAVDEAMQEGAGDKGLTVAKALMLIQDNKLHVDPSTVVVVDEASMLGTPELKKLMACATVGRANMVLVGDAYQLAPVRARGGMFEQLCAELPWSQRLGEVWRMKDPTERDTSLALRAAHGNRLRKAIIWYRDNGRLHAGDPIAMAADALAAYLNDRAANKDTILIADTWEMADALNTACTTPSPPPGPTVKAARDQEIRVGDIITSRSNDATIDVKPGAGHDRTRPVDQVRNGNRWRVAAIDPDTNRLAAERSPTTPARCSRTTTSKNTSRWATRRRCIRRRVSRPTVRMQFWGGASRAMAYVAMTRGRHNNEAFLYQKFSAEAAHQHATPITSPDLHHLRRGNEYSAEHYFKQILHNDDRPRTMHAEAERTERGLLPEVVAEVIERHESRRRARHATWRAHVKTAQAWHAGHERMAAAAQTRTAGVDLDARLEL